jgi:membrane-associated protease RseP (regulator of RpoE activity)
MNGNRVVLIGILSLSILGGSPGAAQDSACPGGRLVGELGITGLVGAARTFTEEWEPRFRTEPKIRGVVKDGPADGELQKGDVLVAIDGQLITTEQGGHHLANLNPGERVTLRVRRDGEQRDVQVTAAAKCEQRPTGPLAPRPQPRLAPSAAANTSVGADGSAGLSKQGSLAAPLGGVSGAQPRPVPMPKRPTVPPPPAPQGPTIRFGFRLQCQDCGYLKADAKGWPYWSFPQPPVLDRVEPGSPADRAGLQPGDRLTHIDGIPLTTPEGGRRLAEIEAGDTVEWTFLRGGERRQVRVTAVGIVRNRNKSRHTGAAVDAADFDRVRFAGPIGGAFVEVRGAPVNVTEDPARGELVIRSHDVLVRIKIPSTSVK